IGAVCHAPALTVNDGVTAVTSARLCYPSHDLMARILPLTPTVDLTTRRGTLRFGSRLRGADRYLLAVDLYLHLRESHPDTHLGYWVFPLPEGEALNTIGLDFTTIGPGSVWKETTGGR